jgi:hypothetical protein
MLIVTVRRTFRQVDRALRVCQPSYRLEPRQPHCDLLGHIVDLRRITVTDDRVVREVKFLVDGGSRNRSVGLDFQQ